ncbi:MAG: hypothetical protein AAFY16_02095 [Cyanobacteria bacterium J06642_3]
MALLTVFSNNLSPATGSLTSRFTNAAAFYIDAPLITSELEIDVFLQVYFPTATNERVRNLALGKLKDGQIKLNETDTETVVPIPDEFIDSGLEMALFFLSSSATFLEVYVLGKDCTLCEVSNEVLALGNRLDDIESKIDDLAVVNTNNNSNLTTILNLILNAIGVAAPLPLPVPATAEQQAFFFLQ